MNCTWCNKRPAEFEIVVHHLRQEMTTPPESTGKKPVPQLLRGSTYCTVRVCKGCLPITNESDVMMGRGAKKPTNV